MQGRKRAISIGTGLGLWLVLGLGCGSPGTPAEPEADDGATAEAPATSSSTGDGSDETTGPGEETTGGEAEPVYITHAFDRLPLAPTEDNSSRCVSWTLNNEQPLYAQSVLVSNEGYFHHSNWFVVPEGTFEGKDGYWQCSDRGYTELAAGQAGTVLFAQSTQSYVEEQRLAPGAVVKIPPHSVVVAGLHTLNTAPRPAATKLYLTLEPIHPRDVTTVVTPLAMQYHDLHIPANSEVRVTASCQFAPQHMGTTGEPLDMFVHYVLPHYHYLGNFFDIRVLGGELDGQSIYDFEGFDGQANGKTFDPPLHLPGATGLAVTCGFDNWRSTDVEWGDAYGEMCVMMALVEADAKMVGSVSTGDTVIDVQDGIQYRTGDCFVLSMAKGKNQGMPTQAEIDGPLYLPPGANDQIPPVPECHDADRDAEPEDPVTLESLRATIFDPSCTFSSCHNTGGAAGLDLTAPDLHAELLDHQVTTAPGVPLVEPGDPEGSWLYRLVADCDPMLENGATLAHMPKGAPTLIDDALVAKLRAWIKAGANP